MSTELNTILKKFGFDEPLVPYGNGHINDTYLINTTPKYIFQKINKNVFPDPVSVMENVKAVTDHLRTKIIERGGDPDRETLTVVPTLDGEPCYCDENGDYYRMYIYIENARSYDLVEDPMQLYHAAKMFGNFQNMLADFPAEKLHEVIVNFHNTKSRFADFKRAVEEDKAGRGASVPEEIKFVLDREADCSVVVDDIAAGRIPLRVTHNDTKLNNVLLDETTGEGVCVIDLDTVMPGSLLYDFGDALRFGGSSGAEDEKDLSKIWFDADKFEHFARGFIETLPSITPRELELLPFSVKLMTLECGSRFLADYLNGDTYFKTHYPEHNLVRAHTQFKLVKDIEDKYDELMAIVKNIWENR